MACGVAGQTPRARLRALMQRKNLHRLPPVHGTTTRLRPVRPLAQEFPLHCLQKISRTCLLCFRPSSAHGRSSTRRSRPLPSYSERRSYSCASAFEKKYFQFEHRGLAKSGKHMRDALRAIRSATENRGQSRRTVLFHAPVRCSMLA